MSTKIAKMTASYPHYDDALAGAARVEKANLVYRVENVTDSVEHSPGDLLKRWQVEQLCQSKHWSVKIVDADKK